MLRGSKHLKDYTKSLTARYDIIHEKDLKNLNSLGAIETSLGL